MLADKFGAPNRLRTHYRQCGSNTATGLALTIEFDGVTELPAVPETHPVVDFRQQPLWRKLRPNGRSIHDARHHPADTLRGGLDVPVADMRIAQRHLHLGVAE